MAVTQNTYTGNGTTVLYSFTFPYLDTSHIKVEVNGTLTTAYTLANATTVQFNSAPANGAAIRIYRETDDSNPNVSFFPGSAIRAQDLNENFLQALYISQETETFASSQSTAGLQAQITAATNTANTAITTANAASATANGIAGTANTALSNSTSAVSTANTASSTASSAASTASAAQATANTALTTANAALPKSGGTMTGNITFAAGQPIPVSGIPDASLPPAKLSQPLTRGTAIAATSGTSIDFTNIPSWVRRITVLFDVVSTTGTSPVIVQLGDAGGVETTGYVGSAAAISGTNSTVLVTYTTGASVAGSLATTQRSGSVVITNITGNRWVFNGIGTNEDVGFVGFTSATKTLSDTLDRIRITTVNGTDTFDAGSVNIIYEG